MSFKIFGAFPILTILFIFCVKVSFLSCNSNQRAGSSNTFFSNTILLSLANKYGLLHLPKIDYISFSFEQNQKPFSSGKKILRSWQWFPNEDIVVDLLHGTSYSRKEMNVQNKKIDRLFINDHYWLFFAFHLLWDENKKIIFIDEKCLSPLSQKNFNKLRVEYFPSGYSPGDIYDVYYDDEFVIREWEYFKGGELNNGKKSIWENNKNILGSILSTKRVGEDGLEIIFKNIEVSLKK